MISLRLIRKILIQRVKEGGEDNPLEGLAPLLLIGLLLVGFLKSIFRGDKKKLRRIKPPTLNDPEISIRPLSPLADPSFASGSEAEHPLSMEVPLKGDPRISSPYGKGMLEGHERFHKGIDYAVPIGTKVYAAASGTVDYVGEGKDEGKYIRIKHGKYISYYMHLSAFADNLKKGDRVSKGMMIGLSGNTGHSTGPHLHFGVKQRGTWINPEILLESMESVNLAEYHNVRDIKSKGNESDVMGAVQIDPWLTKISPNYQDRIDAAVSIKYGAAADKRYYEAMPKMVSIFESYGVPKALVMLCLIESACNPVIKSKVGAVGWWQFMPSTARDWGLQVSAIRDDRTDILLSTDAAARYLKWLHSYLGSWILAVAAYNCGPGNMRKCKEVCKTNSPWDIMDEYKNIKPAGYEENKMYVAKLIGAWLNHGTVAGMCYDSTENILRERRAQAMSSTTVIEDHSINKV